MAGFTESSKVAYYNLYQEVHDLIRHTRCDEENERMSGNTRLPEQHFLTKKKRERERSLRYVPKTLKSELGSHRFNQ